jgi:hypothetical protein
MMRLRDERLADTRCDLTRRDAGGGDLSGAGGV